MKSELQTKIEKDFIEAYKAKVEQKINVLRMIKSAIKNIEIEKHDDLKEEEVISILKKEIKQRKDTIEIYQKAGKTEARGQEQAEIEIIEIYLPKQLDEAEIRKIIIETINKLGANEISKMGQVIGSVMKDHGSEIDGGTVSRIVKEEITK